MDIRSEAALKPEPPLASEAADRPFDVTEPAVAATTITTIATWAYIYIYLFNIYIFDIYIFVHVCVFVYNICCIYVCVNACVNVWGGGDKMLDRLTFCGGVEGVCPSRAVHDAACDDAADDLQQIEAR